MCSSEAGIASTTLERQKRLSWHKFACCWVLNRDIDALLPTLPRPCRAAAADALLLLLPQSARQMHALTPVAIA